MAEPDDSELQSTPAPPVPTSFEPPRVRTLIATSSRYGRLPGGEFIEQCVDQLKFALKEHEEHAVILDKKDNDLLRVTRELETANAECRQLRKELLAKLQAPKEAEAEKPLAPSAADKPRRGGRPKKIVDLPPQAQAQ